MSSFQPTGWRRVVILFAGFFGWLVVIPLVLLAAVGVGWLVERF